MGPQQYHDKPPLRCGYYAYWSGRQCTANSKATSARTADGRPVPPTTTSRWSSAAIRRVRSEQDRPRGQLPQDLRVGARTRRPAPHRQTRDSHRRHRRAQLLPQTVRPWPGAGRRCRLQQRPHHRARKIRRVPRRRTICATALDETFSGARTLDDAMADYHATRDGHVLPMYEFTTQLATLEPPPPERQQLLGAVNGDQNAMDGFARVNAGVTSPAECFSEESVGRIFAAAAPNVGTCASVAAECAAPRPSCMSLSTRVISAGLGGHRTHGRSADRLSDNSIAIHIGGPLGSARCALSTPMRASSQLGARCLDGAPVPDTLGVHRGADHPAQQRGDVAAAFAVWRVRLVASGQCLAARSTPLSCRAVRSTKPASGPTISPTRLSRRSTNSAPCAAGSLSSAR